MRIAKLLPQSGILQHDGLWPVRMRIMNRNMSKIALSVTRYFAVNCCGNLPPYATASTTLSIAPDGPSLFFAER